MINDTIPFYDLYQEAFISEEPAAAHVENIAHRSLGLDWEIESHRHNRLSQIVVVLGNSWTAELDGHMLQLDGNWLVLIPAGVVHSFHFAPDTRGFVLSINNDLISANSSPNSLTGIDKLTWQPQAIEFKDDKQINHFCNYINMLKYELNTEQLAQGIAVNQLVQLILLTVARQQNHQAMIVGRTSRESRTLFKFRELIEQHYTEQFAVNVYAQHLHVSVSTLNRLCQHLLKNSPKAIIHQRTIIEAKRRLIYTQQSIEEISTYLGFNDPAYFSRFFKQLVGLTAGRFREQVNSQ